MAWPRDLCGDTHPLGRILLVAISFGSAGLVPQVQPDSLAQLGVRLTDSSRFGPTCTGALHKSERMTCPLQSSKAGAGKAALYTHTGRFLTVDKAGLGATLSALSGPWTGRSPAMQLADWLALRSRSSALLPGALGRGLALGAHDSPARCS